MLFSKRELLHIVVPLIITQTLAVALGIEDSVMVSAAGEAAISGVALVDRINAMLVYLFTSLSAGGSVVISQMMGTGQIKRANHAVNAVHRYAAQNRNELFLLNPGENLFMSHGCILPLYITHRVRQSHTRRCAQP